MMDGYVAKIDASLKQNPAYGTRRFMDTAESVCKIAGHDFDQLLGGTKCNRCGIVYCPVAYDHTDEPCACCTWNGN